MYIFNKTQKAVIFSRDFGRFSSIKTNFQQQCKPSLVAAVRNFTFSENVYATSTAHISLSKDRSFLFTLNECGT